VFAEPDGVSTFAARSSPERTSHSAVNASTLTFTSISSKANSGAGGRFTRGAWSPRRENLSESARLSNLVHGSKQKPQHGSKRRATLMIYAAGLSGLNGKFAPILVAICFDRWQRAPKMMRSGSLPYWAKDEKLSYSTFNARAHADRADLHRAASAPARSAISAASGSAALAPQSSRHRRPTYWRSIGSYCPCELSSVPHTLCEP
jgi:hypothetical protein